MGTAGIIITSVAIAANAFSGFGAMLRLDTIRVAMAQVDVPEHWLVFPSGVAKLAGALGLLLGLLGVPLVGSAAAPVRGRFRGFVLDLVVEFPGPASSIGTADNSDRSPSDSSKGVTHRPLGRHRQGSALLRGGGAGTWLRRGRVGASSWSPHHSTCWRCTTRTPGRRSSTCSGRRGRSAAHNRAAAQRRTRRNTRIGPMPSEGHPTPRTSSRCQPPQRAAVAGDPTGLGDFGWPACDPTTGASGPSARSTEPRERPTLSSAMPHLNAMAADDRHQPTN